MVQQGDGATGSGKDGASGSDMVMKVEDNLLRERCVDWIVRFHHWNTGDKVKRLSTTIEVFSIYEAHLNKLAPPCFSGHDFLIRGQPNRWCSIDEVKFNTHEFY